MDRIRVAAVALFVLAGAFPSAEVLGQPAKGPPRYEPSQRARTPLDTCLRDEVMNGPHCVKKCQPGFRLELAARPPTCIGLKNDAVHIPSPPAWKPSEPRPATKPVQPAGTGEPAA